jgi:N-acetylmuramic acid 6-phosphate etherase
VLAGSTRLKAGTATKMTLNAVTTTAMVLLGKCYGARMVDLVAGSAKLRARARRMVADLTGRRGAQADALLRAAGGRVKVAVVMARLSLPRRQAERRLRAAGGRLRDLLGPPR